MISGGEDDKPHKNVSHMLPKKKENRRSVVWDSFQVIINSNSTCLC